MAAQVAKEENSERDESPGVSALKNLGTQRDISPMERDNVVIKVRPKRGFHRQPAGGGGGRWEKGGAAPSILPTTNAEQRKNRPVRPPFPADRDSLRWRNP